MVVPQRQLLLARPRRSPRSSPRCRWECRAHQHRADTRSTVLVRLHGPANGDRPKPWHRTADWAVVAVPVSHTCHCPGWGGIHESTPILDVLQEVAGCSGRRSAVGATDADGRRRARASRVDSDGAALRYGSSAQRSLVAQQVLDPIRQWRSRRERSGQLFELSQHSVAMSGEVSEVSGKCVHQHAGRAPQSDEANGRRPRVNRRCCAVVSA